MDKRRFLHGSRVNANLYSMAYGTRTRLGDLLKIMMVFGAIGSIVFFITYTFALNHLGGMSRSATMGSLWLSGFYVMDSSGMPGGLTFETWNTVFAAGFIIPFIVHLIRSHIPVFFWSTPAFLMTLYYMDWMLPPALFGLLFKLVLTRAVGPKRYFEYVTPITAGACVSAGILSLLDTLYNIFTYQIPFAQTWYAP